MIIMSKDNKRIATLWDKKDSDDDRDHSHEGQAFYAGGSEHSGQQILGPSRDGSDRLIQNLFNHARQSANLVTDQQPSGSGEAGGPTSLPIVFWRNGFTVGDEEELRSYEAASNRQFLECLKNGETPPELASRVRGGMIDVKMEHKAHEDYKPVKKLQAFSGEGRRLGAPSPETVESGQEKQADSQATANNDNVNTNLVLDDSKPIATIQIRLVDNSRLVVRVNLTHNIGDIVSHVRQVRPQYAATNFVLATTYPAKELTDLQQTVGDAKLANASVLQKIKR